MTIDLLVRETLERELADIRVPRADVARIRRAGGGRRRARILGGLVAILAVVGASTALVLGDRAEPSPSATTVDVPPMDFGSGLRGLYDASRGLTKLGGQTFDLGDIEDLGDSAASTPYGLVFFGEDQSARLLPSDGRVRTLAAGPARAGEFTPTIRFDPSNGQVAWLTRGNGQVTLSVYVVANRLKLLASYDVPCAGEPCGALAVAGYDQGMVFVRGENGTRVLDPSAGQAATWTQVTDSRVTDVRSKVILAENPSTDPLPAPLADGTWRVVAATSRDALLTLDGAWQLGTSTTLTATTPGTLPAVLPVPAGPGRVSLNLDSDGTVMVARAEGDADVIWDCGLGGACAEIARFDGLGGESAFIGNER